MMKKNLPTKIKKFPSTDREVIQSFLITTARYDFNLYEKRIMTGIVSLLQDKLEGKKLRGKIEPDLFGDYRFDDIRLSDLMPDFEKNPKLYREAIISLRNRVFEFENDEVWKPIGIIEMPKVFGKRGVVSFIIQKEMIEVFLNFTKGYSKYTLGVSLGLKSVYAVRLYELLSNQKISLLYPIDKLKEIFQVSEKYKENTNFINRCIKPAKKELDENANWSFDFSLIKEGKKYKYIKFTPIHIVERESEEIQRQEATRRVSLMWHLEMQVSRFLKGTCKFTDRELKPKITLNRLQKFQNKYGHMSVSKMSEIWERAKNNNLNVTPKSYFMASIKDEVKEL